MRYDVRLVRLDNRNLSESYPLMENTLSPIQMARDVAQYHIGKEAKVSNAYSTWEDSNCFRVNNNGDGVIALIHLDPA